MGYLHIENLERNTDILQFRFCYAMEKIHGTSAHIRWTYGNQSQGENSEPKYELSFFSGGESHEKFVALFDTEKLSQLFKDKFGDQSVVVYGEAYGGKQQGMSHTYGDKLRFIVFDVKIGDSWLSVDKAAEVALSLGLDFVDYVLVSTDIEVLERERDRPSTQAVRNGITEEKMREGVVLRPPFEITKNNGGRVIAKFKRPEFSERKTNPTKFDPERQAIMANANNVAFEFVTANRIEHVVNRLISERDDKEVSIRDTAKMIELTVEDILREEAKEAPDTREVRKAIGTQTVKMFKQYLGNKLRKTL